MNQNHQFRIIHVNIRGIRANKQNLFEFLRRRDYPEIVTINETKLNNSVPFSLDKYLVAARHDSSHGHHGSLILVKNNVNNLVSIDCFQDLESEVIAVKINGTGHIPTFNVCTYYNPPKHYTDDKVFDRLKNLSGPTFLLGDLNCKNEFWGSTKDDKYGNKLLQSLNDNMLVVLNNGDKTRCNPFTGKEETLDLAVCNTEALNYFSEFHTEGDVGSDHIPIILTLSLNSAKTTQDYRKIEDTDWGIFKSLLKDITINQPTTTEEVDSLLQRIVTAISLSFQTACPLKKRKTNSKSSFTYEMRQCVKEKRRLKRLKCDALRRDNYLLAGTLQSGINRLSNNLKKLQKEKQKIDLQSYCEDLNKEKDSAKFFQIFNKASCKEKPQPSFTTVHHKGKTATNDSERAELFADFLEETHSPEDFPGFNNDWKEHVDEFIHSRPDLYTTDLNSQYSQPEPGDDHCLLVPITPDEIKSYLNTCKNKSSPGKNGINYVMLKKLPSSMLTALAKIFSSCTALGYFPTLWKVAVTKMLEKPGKDKKCCKGYRPISLICCIGKLYERIIAGRLSAFLEKNNLIAQSQSGFRKGRMTSEQLLRLSQSASNSFKKRGITASLLLDAEAAFDKAWHNGIRYKLHHNLKLPSRLIRLLSSFLTNRKLSVEINKHRSREIEMKAGTPQGSCLSPLLYLILVNDIPAETQENASLSQYADDIGSWSHAFTFRGGIQKLQKSVNMLEGWCRRWRIKINSSKSNLLIIHRLPEQTPDDLCILLFNDVIRPSPVAKFLGIEFDAKLSFKKHTDSIITKCKRRLNAFKVLSVKGVDNRTMIRLYKTYVRPIFEYGCLAFLAAESQIQRIQRLQNDFIRICLKLPRYLRTDLIHEAAGIETVEKRLQSLSSRLFSKMENLPSIETLKDDHFNTTPLNNYISPFDLLLQP
jgi:hypothetical protein